MTLEEMLDNYRDYGTGDFSIQLIKELNKDWKYGEIFKVPRGTPILTENTVEMGI